MKTLGDRIREIREQKNMSQQELAAKSGISQATISDLEGNKQESTRKIFEIAQALGVPVAALAPTGQTALESSASTFVEPPADDGQQIDIEQAMAVAEGIMLSAGLDPRNLAELRELLRECFEEPQIVSNPQSEADARRNSTRSAFSRFLKTLSVQDAGK